MDVNDDAGYLNARGVLASIASRLAPTGIAFHREDRRCPRFSALSTSNNACAAADSSPPGNVNTPSARSTTGSRKVMHRAPSSRICPAHKAGTAKFREPEYKGREILPYR